MKSLRNMVVVGLMVSLLATPAMAVDDYDDSQANPLRLIAYVLHPIGYAVEWLFTRPIHRLFAQEDLEPIFGHVPHEGYDYESYTEGMATGVTIDSPAGTIRERSQR
ncbi:MAG: hypothetical protein VCC00_08270 [Deltaproteobacteria bacterium]